MSGLETTALIISLMNFASATTGLPVTNDLPTIVWQDRCTLQRTFEPGILCVHKGARVVAMYRPGTGTIGMSEDDLDIKTLKGKAALLHEIVHYLQDVAIQNQNAAMIDKVNSSDCIEEAYEAAAYNAEIAYIRQNGQDPWRVMDLSYPFYYFLTTCREENDYDL